MTTPAKHRQITGRDRDLHHHHASPFRRVAFDEFTDEREKFQVIIQSAWLRPFDAETAELVERAQSGDDLREINQCLIEIINQRIWGQVSLSMLRPSL